MGIDHLQENTTLAMSESPNGEPTLHASEVTQSGARGFPKKRKMDLESGREGWGAQRDGPNKKRKMGRKEYNRSSVDKRARNEQNWQATKPDGEVDEERKPLPIYATKFTREEIEAEPRRPKNKVAVMMGYSGSGYKGMQLNDTERTIEGDLFGAFVRAGAISKANADDAKKSSLVRCARTDKGVHAAGNIISLKLITEDPEIVSKINTHLSPQIRVFGISRVNGSFSAYHLCDSRVYEYLIPTHCFLPPHPDSFLAKKLLELANEAGDLEGYQTRQAEASTFWTAAEQEYINPLLESIPPNLLPLIQKALYQPTDVADSEASSLEGHSIPVTLKDSFDVSNNPSSLGNAHAVPSIPRNAEPIIKELRTAHLLAKQAYRISPARMERICATVNLFVGTHSFHNYTLHKKFRDPSASRVIKSIALDPHPRIVNGTEWVSIKLHGQSFMMHQIRKMVSMAAMVVRCGAEPHKVIPPSFGRDRLSIPKAPGLGLLLERPIFDAFNEKKLVGEFRREPVGFTKYEAEMKEFKRREIYDRIWREEAEGNIFHSYFASVDNLRTSQMLYLSSMGIKAAVRGLEGDRETNAADGAMAQAAIVCEDSEEEVDGAIDG